MNLNKLFSLSYLFDRYPNTGFSWPVMIILLIIFIGALILAFYAGHKRKLSSGNFKKLWGKIQVWSWTAGLTGLLFVYLREVRALYLSSRFWLLLFLIIMIIWALLIAKYWKKEIPAKEERQKQSEEFNKWLPKKKNK